MDVSIPALGTCLPWPIFQSLSHAFTVSLHMTSMAEGLGIPKWEKGGKARTGVPEFPLICKLTQIAVIIDGAGLASLQLPLNEVDQVLGVIGFCNLLLGGGQDLAWGRGRGRDGRGRAERGALGDYWVGFQKSDSRKGSLWKVVGEDT